MTTAKKHSSKPRFSVHKAACGSINGMRKGGDNTVYRNNMKFLLSFQRPDSSSSINDTSTSKDVSSHTTDTSGEVSTLPLHQQDIVHDELVSILSAMQDTETNGAYKPSGKFVYPELDEQLSNSTATEKKNLIVDDVCRVRMLDWSAKMVDYFDIDRSIVSLAVYYQDCYLATEEGKLAQTDRSIFRVVSVTSLYIAIKLRAPQKWNITATAFSQLCQGTLSGKDISDTEIKILFALGWNVNPPIAMQYVEAFLELLFNPSSSRMNISLSSLSNDSFDMLPLTRDLLPSSSAGDDNKEERKSPMSHQELRSLLHELISYQLEIALHEKRLYATRSSVIAAAAVVNALKGVANEGVDGLFCRECIAVTLDIMSQCKIASTVELDDVRSVLLRLVVSVEGGQDTQEVAQISTSETDRTHDITQSDEENYREPPQQPPRNNGPVSSSPTSATDKLCWPPSSKLGGLALTPQRVLSTVS